MSPTILWDACRSSNQFNQPKMSSQLFSSNRNLTEIFGDKLRVSSHVLQHNFVTF